MDEKTRFGIVFAGQFLDWIPVSSWGLVLTVGSSTRHVQRILEKTEKKSSALFWTKIRTAVFHCCADRRLELVSVQPADRDLVSGFEKAGLQ